MTETAQVRDLVAKLRNRLGLVVPSAEDDDGMRVSALAATGRLVTAPGQTIASAWGNTTYDQTTNVFTSAADRDAQWTAPKEGARCFLLDTHLQYIRHTAGWVVDQPYRTLAYQSVFGVAATGGVGPVAYPGAVQSRHRAVDMDFQRRSGQRLGRRGDVSARDHRHQFRVQPLQPDRRPNTERDYPCERACYRGVAVNGNHDHVRQR